MAQPLAGVSVVELAQGIAGPYAGKLLADYGADVVKVEPPGGDRSRRAGPWPAGAEGDPERSALFLHLNTNKRSLVADPGAAVVDRLLARADVVLRSSDDPPLDRLAALAPGAVVVTVTSFGLTGPYAGYAGEEIVHIALGGPLSASGLPDREPVKMGGAVGQYQCGTMAAVAALAGLTVAATAGRGVHVDLSNVDTQVASIDRRMTYLLYGSYRGQDVPRFGGYSVSPFPGGCRPAADGHVQVSTLMNWIPRMLAVMDDPEMSALYADEAWFFNPELPALADAQLLAWTLTRDRQEAMEQAQAGGWPVTAVNRPVDLLTDPHFAQRQFFVTVDHPLAGPVRQPGPPIRLDDGWALHRPAPTLDQHGAEIEAEIEAEIGAGTGEDPDSGAAPDPGPRGLPEAAPGLPCVAPASTDAGPGLPVAPPAAAPAHSAPSGGAPDPAGRGPLPLAGIRVLDLTVVWAGPYATCLLGDLGADVVRVDNPYIFPTATRGVLPRPPAEIVADIGGIFGGYPEGEPGARPWNRIALFNAHARNKRSVTLDARKPLGRETFLRLVERCDLMVENNSIELLDKLGLSWDTLHQRNPRLILVRLPSVGLTGPYRNYLGFGVNFEALCGLGALRGYTDADLSENEPVFHMDAASGSAGALAALMAVRRRERTGVGELVEVSQSENMLSHIGELLIEAGFNGTEQPRLGNRHPTRAPQGCYRCRGDDAWAVLSVGPDQWEGFLDAAGRPPWGADARFATEAGRREHHDELDGLISAWTAGLSPYEVFHRCQAHGVAAAPVLHEREAFADPHLQARGLFRLNGNADTGDHLHPTHPWRWNGPELRWDRLPVLGGDNQAVYQGLLGLSDDEYAALVADGHISLDYLTPDGTPL